MLKGERPIPGIQPETELHQTEALEQQPASSLIRDGYERKAAKSALPPLARPMLRNDQLHWHLTVAGWNAQCVQDQSQE